MNWNSRLKSYSHYSERFFELSHWRLSTGQEVDFIIDDMHHAIEAKACKQIHNKHLKGLRELKRDYPKVEQRTVVCLESKERITEDGIRILPAATFCRLLWDGALC